MGESIEQDLDVNKENITAPVISAKEIVTIEVLAVIKEAQSQHGIKHSDYLRYRQFCSKRLRRLRKVLNFVQSVGAKTKAVYHFKPITAQLLFETKRSSKETIKYLSIPLICAERSWSYAMQLKQDSAQEPRKKYHMIRKFRNACVWADLLKELCNSGISKCDVRTKLESEAYSDYLNGIYKFETEQWQEANRLLTKAQSIYEKFLPLINDEEVLGFYRQRVEEIKPTLRYCAFNIGEAAKGDGKKTIKPDFGDPSFASKLDLLMSQSKEQATDSLSEVQWLGKGLFVKFDKIRSFIASLKDPKRNWKELSTFEEMIFECRDCLQLLRENNSDRTGLYQYLTFLRGDLSIKRNLLLIASLQNNPDILRQYEIIIGCLNEMKQLTLKLYFTDNYLVDRFFAEIDTQIIYYKAFRAYYIALVANDNWKESVALFDRSVAYCKEAMSSEYLTDKDLKDKLLKLSNQAETEKFALYTEAISQEGSNASTIEKTKSKLPLLERLNELNLNSDALTDKPQLTSAKPDYKAIPCKPLFFDLALNHIQFPPLDEEINANKQQAGVSGLVSRISTGWLGWRK